MSTCGKAEGCVRGGVRGGVRGAHDRLLGVDRDRLADRRVPHDNVRVRALEDRPLLRVHVEDLRNVRLGNSKIIWPCGVLSEIASMWTNRQAILLADAYFSRSRAVPAILDAVLLSGEAIGEFTSILGAAPLTK